MKIVAVVVAVACGVLILFGVGDPNTEAGVGIIAAAVAAVAPA